MYFTDARPATPMAYLPFFTGCTGGVADANGNVPLDRVFSDPEYCHIVPENEMVTISEWDISATRRLSDVCSYSMRCTHAEPAEEPKALPFWNTEVEHGVALFWLTSDPVDPGLLSEAPTTYPTAGMQEEERAAIVRANTERFPNGYFETTRRMLGDESFMAVRVVPHPPISCKPWCQGPFDELFATNPEYLEWGVNASASITNLDDVNLQISEEYTEMAEQAIDRKQALFIQRTRVPSDFGCTPPFPPGFACYPRKATLVVKYWQKPFSERASLRRRLVTANVFLEDFTLLPTREVDEHASRPTYELGIAFVPADWFDLFNHFALPTTFYVVFYVAVALLIGFGMMLIWCLFRIVKAALPASCLPRCLPHFRRGRAAPKLRFLQFLWLYMHQKTTMVAIAVPLVVLVLLVAQLAVANPFRGLVGEHNEITSANEPTRAQLERWTTGRVGLILFVFGILALRDSIRLWVPDGSAPRHTVSAHRFQLVSDTAIKMVGMYFTFEFCLSTLYALAPTAFYIVIKINCMVFEFVVARRGNAIFFPQVMLLEITAYIGTGFLGAADFRGAIFMQLIEIGINVFRRIFIEPPKGRLLSRVHVHASVKRATTQAPPPPADGDERAAVPGLPMPKEAARQAFHPPPRLSASAEDDEKDDAGDDVDLGLRHTLVIWCTDTAALYIEFLMLIAMYLLRKQFNLEALFRRRSGDLIYFMLFVSFLVPASWIEDVFTNNVNELLWGWDATAYMQRQADRFKRRQHAWALSAPAADERKRPWERLDRVLMTNQLWLLLMLYGCGALATLLGWTLLIREQPRFFADPIFMPLVVILRGFWAALRYVARKVFVRVCRVEPRSKRGHQRV